MAKKSVKPRSRTLKPVALAAPVNRPQPLPSAPAAGRRLLIRGVVLLLSAALAAQIWLSLRQDKQGKLMLKFGNVLAVDGKKDGQLCCLTDMTVDGNGDVITLEVPELGHRLQKISAAGRSIAVYRPQGPAQAFKFGSGVATGPDNKVYVVETVTGLIKVLSPDLKFIKNIPIPSRATAGMVVNSKGEFYICDQEKTSILHLDKDGKLIDRLVGGKQRIVAPHRLALSTNDDVFLLDMSRGMYKEPDVKAFGPDGVEKASWTIRGLQANPYNAIAWHPKGMVVVNDNLGNPLAKGLYFYTEKGKAVGNAMFTDNQLNLKNTSAIAIDRKRGDIFLNTNSIGRAADRFTWEPDAPAKN